MTNLKMRTGLWFVLAFAFVPLSLSAQKRAQVGGAVVDAATGEGVGYATVQAMDLRGRRVGVAVTGPSGEFALTLAVEEYKLLLSMVGYKGVSVPVAVSGARLDLGKITMEPGVDLEAVVVEPMIRVEADRIVYDVGRDPDAARMKMMEIFSKVPQLRMDHGDGKLEYGETKINKILVDGREDGTITGQRQYPMNFIRADVMSRIEVILPGSAEYNNEKPIINIKLSRPLPFGVAGQLSPRAATNGNYGGEIDLVTKNRAGNFGVNYAPGYLESPTLTNVAERENLLPDAGVRTSRDESRSDGYGRSHAIGLSFAPERRKGSRIAWRVDAGARTSENVSGSTSTSLSEDRNGSVVEELSTTSRSRNSAPFRLNGGANMSGWFGPDRQHWLTARYSFDDSETGGEISSDTRSPAEPRTGRRSLTATGTTQHAVNLTYFLLSKDPKKGHVGIVAGYVNRHYGNSSGYHLYDPATGGYIEVTERFQGIDYTQQVMSVDAFYSHSVWDRKLSYSLRLRGENVVTEGDYTGPAAAKLDYGEMNLLPRASITTYNTKPFRLHLNYSTSVRRPGMDQLNPFVDDSDPMNVRRGNPNLKGEYSHSFGGSISPRFNPNGSRWVDFGLSGRISFSNGLISRATEVDGQNVAVTSYYNLGRSVSRNVSLSYSPRIFKALTLRLSGDYSVSNYHFPDRSRNTVRGLSGSLGGSVYVQDASLLDFTYSYRPAFTSVQNTRNSYYSNLDINVQRYFKKLHLGGRIHISDALNGRRSVVEHTGSSQFTQWASRERIGRVVSLSVYWQFGRFRESDKYSREKSEVYDMGDPGE